MWTVVARSAQGTSHRKAGQPCQDYGEGRVIDTAAGAVLIAGCADGAGSAERSAFGAQLAVRAFLDCAAQALKTDGLDVSNVDGDTLRVWVSAARCQMEGEAKALGAPLREFACTLLTAVVGPNTAAFSQIGDGVIVRNGPEGYQHVFWPDSGEYANTTWFLTDSNFERYWRYTRLTEPVQDVALLTDGLQMLALEYATRRAHERFFGPLFGALRAAPNDAALQDALDAFLDSPRVNERTDDDKTLVLATRMHQLNHDPVDPAPTL